MNSKHNAGIGSGQRPGLKATNNGTSKKTLPIIATILVLIAAGVAAGLVPRLRHKADLAAETRKLADSGVSVVSPSPGQAASSLPLPAEIKPWAEASIYARANGYLVKRHVDIGTRVKEGQLLAEIDTPELNQELARAKGQLVQAETALGLAKKYSARWSVLLTSGSVSDQENADKQADFKLKAAAVDSARAEVGRLEKLLSFNRLTAPFDGTITVRNVDSGDLIGSAGAKELFHLAQTRKLRVSVQAPQIMAQSIRPGQPAEMTLQEMPGRSFPATVIRTAGAISADSRTLLVELEVDNSKDEILAGSYAQVRFNDLKTNTTPTLPANTIIYRADGPHIGVVHEGGEVELRAVKLGRDFGQRIEIVTGVGLNDRVIINPSDSLKDGNTVSIKSAANANQGQ